MAISGIVSIPEWGRDSEREGGGAYPARLCPQDAEEVVSTRRCHIRSALPDTQNHPIVSAWQINVSYFLYRIQLTSDHIISSFYCIYNTLLHYIVIVESQLSTIFSYCFM